VGQQCADGRNKERAYIVSSSNMRRIKKVAERKQGNVWMSWYLPSAKGKWDRKGKSSLHAASTAKERLSMRRAAEGRQEKI